MKEEFIMIISIGCDHSALELKDELIGFNGIVINEDLSKIK
mgnify:CR=1 FL=1